MKDSATLRKSRPVNRIARFFITVLFAFGSLLGPSAFAAVDTETLQRAETLIQTGKADEAYLLLEPLELDNAGDQVYDYLLATAALESGRPSRATFVYERILAVEPGYVGVRADMGRAYYALGDFARAKIEFETVLSVQNLPPDLRTSVEQYVSAAEARSQAKRTIFSSYVDMSWGLDTNINSATSSTSVTFAGLPPPNTIDLTPPDTKTRDNYTAASLGGEVTHQFSERWAAFVGADLRTRHYWVYEESDNWSGDGRLGFNYAGGRWLLRGAVNGGQYSQNDVRLRDSVGLSLDWRYAISNGSQLSANAAQTRYTYVSTTNKSNDNDTMNGSITWLQAIGDGSTIISGTYAGGYEYARNTRQDGDRSFHGPRLLAQTSFAPTIGAFVSAGASFSTYNAFNDSFLVEREDNLYDIAIGVTFSLAKGVALRPQVSYVRNDSNIELFDSGKFDAGVNFRMDW